MKIEQRRWTRKKGWRLSSVKLDSAELVFAFGAPDLLKDPALFEEIRSFHPEARIVSASTAGEIMGDGVTDDSIVYTAISFSSTSVQLESEPITDSADSYKVGKILTSRLATENLSHVLIFSDGLNVNGSELVRGLLEPLRGKEVSVTGGLVADGAAFKETVLGLDDVATAGQAIIVAFYGKSLKVGYGSLGGWDSFGPSRTITKSQGNVLYELDNKPALTLYKKYLGDLARNLPGSGLLFPLSLRVTDSKGNHADVVRTVLGVDETSQSMTFAGDMPVGVEAKLMKANFERLIDGAEGATKLSLSSLKKGEVDFALLISCVGRKLVLKHRVDEEVEAVSQTVGHSVPLAGFYSYGEISPGSPTERQCQLHNQTMTITVFREG